MADEPVKIRRLHIGGKEVKDGWEILDALPGAHVNHVGNARDLSRFPDGTFTDLYASHVLEHFDYRDEIILVLRDWLRVLKPGGTLYVSVPDMERLCHLYLTPRLQPAARYEVMRMLFGGHMDQYDYHLAGIDEGYLTEVLKVAGFRNMRRVNTFDMFRDTSILEVLGMPVSLNMVASR